MSLIKPPVPALAVVACLLISVCSAHAQINPFGRSYSRFSAEDLRLMQNQVQRLLKTGRVGSVMSWKNDESGNFGTMELEREFMRDNLPCRRLDHVVKFTGEKDARLFRLTYCRVGDEWKLAQ